MSRRLMLRSAKTVEISHFIPGTYTGTSTSAPVNTVDQNSVITCNTGDILFNVSIPITNPVYYQAGDVITLEQDTNYTSLKGKRVLTLRGSADLLVFNSEISNYESKSVTASASGFFDTMYWGYFKGYQAGARIRYRILINGNIVVE